MKLPKPSIPNRPKLKQTGLCRALLWLPVYAWLLYLLVMLFLPPKQRHVGILLLLLGLSLYTVSRGFEFFLRASRLFRRIHALRNDREVYPTDFRCRSEAEDLIFTRCEHWGDRSTVRQADGKVCMFQRSRRCFSLSHSFSEERILLYTTDHLRSEDFQHILSDARKRSATAKDGIPHLSIAEEKPLPRRRLVAVIVLSDEVEDSVKALALQRVRWIGFSAVLPCVIDCGSGNCYLDGSDGYRSTELFSVREKMQTLAIVKDSVFGGKLPVTPTDEALCIDGYSVEDSFWSYLAREWKKAEHTPLFSHLTPEESESGRALRTLRHGEISIGEYGIYCKLYERLAICRYEADENDPKLLTLRMEDRWELKRLVPWEVKHRKMKEKDRKEALRQMKAALLAGGYRIQNPKS